MWRFILVSFAFLGLAFYILSGGSDYEPRPDSIQARSKIDLRPVARAEPEPVDEAPEVKALPRVINSGAQSVSTLNDLQLIDKSEVDVALVTTAPEDNTEPATPVIEEVALPQIGEPSELTTDQTRGLGQIRRVAGFIVNLHDGPSSYYLAIDSLRKNDEVEVIENPGEGWLKVRALGSGRVGWIEDRRLAVAAN